MGKPYAGHAFVREWVRPNVTKLVNFSFMVSRNKDNFMVNCYIFNSVIYAEQEGIQWYRTGRGASIKSVTENETFRQGLC